MKILFLSDNFPPEVNAAASRVFERACYWANWGHEVTVVTSAPNFPQGKVYEGYKNKWYQLENVSDIRVVRVKTFMAPNAGLALRTLDFTSYMFMATLAGLFQKRPDVIIATSPQFFAAVGGWMLAALRRIPFVFELSDLWPASISAVGAMKPGRLLRMVEKLELFLYRRAKAVVALTQSFKDDLIKRNIRADKIEVIINGVDLSKYGPMPKDKSLLKQYDLQDKFIIGYIGTHGMAHGLENVLHCAKLLKTDPNICFLFVGDGAARCALTEEAERCGLTNVKFIPAQPKEIIPRYWSLCDVALIHLKNDSVFSSVIPSKMFEAMAMGLPLLLVSPEGEASKIIEMQNIGLCVPAENPEALAEVANSFCRNGAMTKRFAEASRKAAYDYSRERQAKKMIDVLEGVVGNG